MIIICPVNWGEKSVETGDNYKIGFKSITHDNKHIVLWDFDNVSLKDVIESLLSIQRQFNLSHIYILITTHGYNAICLDKFSKYRVFLIKALTIFSDKMHDILGYNHNGWTLKITEDKKLDSILISPQYHFPKSNAHRKLLEICFDIKISKIPAFDNFENILFERFKYK